MKKTSTVSLAHLLAYGETPSDADRFFGKMEGCLNAARESIAELMLNPSKTHTALADIPTEDGETVEALPSLVSAAISRPYGSLGLDSSDFGPTTSPWYLFQHMAEDFLRGKIDRCRMRKLDTAAERLHLALGCLRWAGLVGVHDCAGFQAAFTSALIYDRDATCELNGETIDVSPITTDVPLEKALLVQIVDVLHVMGVDIKDAKEFARRAAADARAARTRKDGERRNGRKQAHNIQEYNAEQANTAKADARKEKLKKAVASDKSDYPDPTTERPKKYWKDLLGQDKSFQTADALRKAVMRERQKKRGRYEREGKKRGPYRKRI